MDKKRIQAHGITAGGVVDDLVAYGQRGIVYDLKEPVVLHAGSAADPLGHSLARMLLSLQYSI